MNSYIVSCLILIAITVQDTSGRSYYGSDREHRSDFQKYWYDRPVGGLIIIEESPEDYDFEDPTIFKNNKRRSMIQAGPPVRGIGQHHWDHPRFRNQERSEGSNRPKNWIYPEEQWNQQSPDSNNPNTNTGNWNADRPNPNFGNWNQQTNGPYPNGIVGNWNQQNPNGPSPNGNLGNWNQQNTNRPNSNTNFWNWNQQNPSRPNSNTNFGNWNQQYPDYYDMDTSTNRFPNFPVTNRPIVTSSTSASSASVQSCIRSCPVTSEYNPVCGTNNVTYTNPSRLECAKYCGVAVEMQRTASCNARLPGTTQSPTIVPSWTPAPTTEDPRTSGPSEFTTKPSRPTISNDILQSIFTSPTTPSDIVPTTEEEFAIDQRIKEKKAFA